MHTLPLAIENFLDDISDQLSVDAADGFERAFLAIDLEGDVVPDADQFLQVIAWVGRHRNRSAMERIEMIDKLRQRKGYNVISLREFTGWE